jgi:hypothetical protein
MEELASPMPAIHYLQSNTSKPARDQNSLFDRRVTVLAANVGGVVLLADGKSQPFTDTMSLAASPDELSVLKP